MQRAPRTQPDLSGAGPKVPAGKPVGYRVCWLGSFL
jgi:hypothetical protein